MGLYSTDNAHRVTNIMVLIQYLYIVGAQTNMIQPCLLYKECKNVSVALLSKADNNNQSFFVFLSDASQSSEILSTEFHATSINSLDLVCK